MSGWTLTSDWAVTGKPAFMSQSGLTHLLPRSVRHLGLFCCLLLAPVALAERGSHITLDEPLPQPAWELPLIANGEGTVTNSTYLGRVTYVDFWASWCGPCRLSLPALNRLSKEFDAADFGVVAISVDYVNEDALDFLERYVHVTTPEVYGSTSGWVTEHAVINPSTPYAVSRAAGDMLMKIYQEVCDLPVVSTRAANVFGPGQPLYRIIPRTIFSVLTDRRLQLHGGGMSSRSFIHIDDVCEATWKVANEAPIGETYHISTDKIITIRELVEMLCEMLDVRFEETVQSSSERMGKDEAYWLNSEKLRQLGWVDRIPLEAGLASVIAWVRRELQSLSQAPYDYMHKP